MINTDFQQLGSPSSASNGGNGSSAAALLAAALNVATNSTSASNSPPELLSMATTNSSSTAAQLCNPFSPAAAVQAQLAALYSSSIPSPAPLPPLSTAVEQTLANPSTDSSTSFVGAPTLEQLSAIAAAATNVLQASNNGECSANTSVFNPIGMDTSNCVASSSSSVGSQNQQQDETQINSIDTATKNEQQAQNVRRIRRRRPKEEIAGKTLHRRNTTMYGENSSCVSVIEKMVDSPCSLGPFSVQQPLTPANEQICNSVLLKTVSLHI
uniref:Uncharacterized protein n=1 Tax=Meloidogyne javanica TaxID=6303 RepID=A0A915LI46_MELJA